MFFGILTQGNSDNEFTYGMYFSPMQQIVEDLGPIDVLDYAYIGNLGGGGSPPPILSSYIAGPVTQRPGNSCSWIATTDVPNASFEWSILGEVVGTGQTLQYSASESFSLSVVAWNSDGAGSSTSIWVDVSDGNERCYVE